MNKRAFLLAEETLKIVIALISVSFLIYFLSALYFTNQNSKDLEFAEATLESLIESINSGIQEVSIYNPSSTLINKWWITSWPNEGVKPKRCSNLNWESCVCICEGVAASPQGYANDCDDKGMCIQNSNNLVVKVGNNQAPIEIKNPPIKLSIKDGEITEK